MTGVEKLCPAGPPRPFGAAPGHPRSRAPTARCRTAPDRAGHRHLHHGGPGHARHAVRPRRIAARAHCRQHPRAWLPPGPVDAKVAVAPSSTPTKPCWPNSSTTAATAPSSRSRTPSASPAQRSTATSTRPPLAHVHAPPRAPPARKPRAAKGAYRHFPFRCSPRAGYQTYQSRRTRSPGASSPSTSKSASWVHTVSSWARAVAATMASMAPARRRRERAVASRPASFSATASS